MYNENMYIKNVGLNIHKWKTTDDRSLSVLEYVRSICIMYRWTLFEKVWYVQRNIMYTKECYGTYTVMEAHWLKEISQGILSLEPMDSAYKQTDENKWKKFVYVWILTKMFWICTNKAKYVHKGLGLSP